MALANTDYLPVVGRAMSVAERAAMQCSIPLLSTRYSAPARCWGKVCGYKRDYLIAQLLPRGDIFGPRVSFYSIDGGHNWVMLEELTEEQAAFCEELRGVYQGDPNYAYKKRKDIPVEEEPQVELPTAEGELAAAKELLAQEKQQQAHSGDDEENEEEEDEEEEGEEEPEETSAERRRRLRRRGPKYVIVSVTEAIRLSHFVQLHDVACSLVVRGEYLLRGTTPQPNRAWSGQPLQHAVKPSCYVKATCPGILDRNRVLYGATYNPLMDFLMPITDDAPEGVWTVKYDPSLNVVAVQNLLYDGSLFWYRPGTTEHGQVYYGSGERNLELCLLI